LQPAIQVVCVLTQGIHNAIVCGFPGMGVDLRLAKHYGHSGLASMICSGFCFASSFGEFVFEGYHCFIFGALLAHV
jgi:hypothetical protein